MTRCVAIDMASRSDGIISDLKENGVHTVFRYYASGYQSSLPEKRLTKDEKNRLFDAEMAVGVVFQFNNNALSTMTDARGHDDGRFALDFAQDVIEQPKNSAIYFGVDGDWWTTDDQKKVNTYFEAINEEFSNAGSPYKIGVYGSGTTCRNLKSAGLASYFWLPLSTGWSGSRDFYNTREWTFYQNYHGLRIDGRYTDTNIINPAVSEIGTFDRNGVVEKIEQPDSVFSERAFVRASSLNLRGSPNTSSAIVGELRNRRNVRILSSSNGWANLDIDEDGKSEGYVDETYLQKLDQMP